MEEESKQSTTRTHQNELGADGKRPGGTPGGVAGTHKCTSFSCPPTNIKQTTTTFDSEIEAKDGPLPCGTGGESGATYDEYQQQGIAISTTTNTCTQTVIEETKTQVSSQPVSVDGRVPGGTDGGGAGTDDLQKTS